MYHGKRLNLTTFQVIVLGFFALIAVGTLALMLPVSSIRPGSAGFGDCLFTAVSAVCVTGLVVTDTATSWTTAGQAVILVLIQIGGLGVVTAAVCLAFVSRRKIGLMQRSVLQEAISAHQVGGIVPLTRFIVRTALGIEAAGAAVMLPVFVREFGWRRGAWAAVFHAVSAFCNAGFDLTGVHGRFSSMTGYAGSIPVNAALMLLITLGGIGFIVWEDVSRHGLHWKRYHLQSRIVLVTSAVLVAVPFVWLLCFETKEMPADERVLCSLFQSVTLRTAGFNTMDLGKISAGGQALMILWMLIGGSPGSTAGGMKTTTAAVLLLTTLAVFRRKEDTTCFGRRIGEDAVRSAAGILLLYGFLFLAGGMSISTLEHLPLGACLFETASALGTVGLSLGITGELGKVSRGILILLMFLGRVGGLTLIYAAQWVRPSQRGMLPMEKIMVG